MAAKGGVFVDRRSKCESIVLTKREKKLLRRISRKPHTKCKRDEIWPLYEMDLVYPDTEGVDAFNMPIQKDTYCVSELYRIYRSYKAELRFWLILKSLWLPIVVSIITNLTVDGIQWLLPLIQQWLSSIL